jgi:hypothetical protein
MVAALAVVVARRQIDDEREHATLVGYSVSLNARRASS